ncbi:hypothetical protein BDW22DRAFT_1395176 [Trametopsis cervina]|nr:hypothetical protein BDW22DRAFT_1395176 [Trametopsis cervina]
MSRVDTPEGILALAKQHLGYTTSVKSGPTLDGYVQELRKHLVEYPQDVHYRLELQPYKGFGIVTCLEEGCKNERIKLSARRGVPDGGKAIGLGSLSPYRVHVSSHPMHTESRDARMWKRPVMETEKKGLSKAPERRKSVFGALDSNSPAKASGIRPSKQMAAAAFSGPPHSSPTRSLDAHSPAFIKVEHEEPALSLTIKKRRSSFALSDSPPPEKKYSHRPSSRNIVPPSSKAIKLEHHDTPTRAFMEAQEHVAAYTPGDVKPKVEDMENLEDTREKLADVQRQLVRVKRDLVRAEDKRHKTKTDYTRIAKLERERGELQAQKEGLNVAIPSMHTHDPQPPTFPAASGSNVDASSSYRDMVADDRDFFINFPSVQYAQPVASGSNVDVQQARSMAVMLDGEEYHTGAYADPALVPPTSTLFGRPVDHGAWDRDGDFHGRGKDHFAGPVARADDINDFLIEAGNAESFDSNESVHNALQKLGMGALYQLLPGMTVALMPHQVIGVAWMADKEQRSSFRGGVLADEMGLGKTVQMIAVMAKNRPTNPARKATLIVAPVALLDQWQYEIEDKSDMNLRCLIYHGNSKPRRLDQLEKYDVVLTTYHTLLLEWPDDEAVERERRKRKKRRSNADEDFIADDTSEEERQVQRRKARQIKGLLFEMPRYRIVLDEAQNIRNKRTRVSRAISKLEAQYRWCLTGTPIVNSLGDAYPLFRFLRIRPWYDWNEFNNHVTSNEKKNPSLAMQRLQVIFRSMLLRRKKDSKLDGKPLIELPPKIITLHKLEFTQEERDIYKMVETQSQAIFNKYLRAGTVLKNYFQVLVMLLRLRQICSHASLITEQSYAFIRPGEYLDTGDKNSELLRAVELVGTVFVEKMRAKYKNLAIARLAAEAESADAALEDEEIECPICFENYVDPVVTPCCHLFCRECVVNAINSFHPDPGPQANPAENHPKCPVCRGKISETHIFSREIFEPMEDELKDEDVEMVDAAPKPAPGRVLRKRKATRGHLIDSGEERSGDDDDYDDLSDFIVGSDEDEEEQTARRELKKRLSKAKGKRAVRKIVVDSDDEYDEDIIHGAKPDIDIEATPEQIAMMPKFLPSTKMKFMMETLRTLASEKPDEKVLVVSQWTQCLQLVSDYLTENGFLHVKYQGDMNRSKRDQAVRAFMSKEKASIMLMSLKCGGVGLNLTRANHVISLDLGWSMAVEQQAYDRVHRLGQHRPVDVQRLVIADTVEDRILALQERKKTLADGALGDIEKAKLGRLSVRELANIFGLDTRGKRIEQ